MPINTTQINSETDLKGTLVNQELSTTGLTCYVSFVDAKTGEARTPQSTTLMFTLDKDNERSESILADSHSTLSGVTTITINASGRALPKFGVGSGSGTGNTHSVGAQVGCVNIARPINQLAAQAVAKDGDTMTAPLVDATYASLAALEAAYPTPTNGMSAYATAEGKAYDALAGSWVARESGGTFPNASTTVAGKVEAATVAEQIAHTSTGATGALLFPQVGNLITSSAGAGDSGKLPIVGTDGRLDNSVHNQTLVGGVTTEASTLHYHEGERSLIAAGEAVDGSTTPQAVYISDGTGGRTAGAFYKADSDDTTNVAMVQVGFVNQNASSIGTSYLVKTSGVVGGFTGLTAGSEYYTSTTAGAITATASTTAGQRLIGIAISTTQLYVYPLDKKPLPISGSASTITIGGTSTVTVYTGYKPKGFVINTMMQNAGTSARAVGFWVAYDGTTWNGFNLDGGTYNAQSTAPVVTGATGNAASITLSATFNSNNLVLTYTNATTAGSGSNATLYRVVGTVFPY